MLLKKLDEKFNKLIKNSDSSTKNYSTEEIAKKFFLSGDRGTKMRWLLSNDFPELIPLALEDKDPSVRQVAISSPSFRPEHMDKALSDPDHNVRIRAIQSKHFGPEHMERAINDKNALVRDAAFGSEYLNKDHYDKAINDEDELIRLRAVKSPYFKPEHMDRALKDPYDLVAVEAVNSPYFGPEHMDQALSHWDNTVRRLASGSMHFGAEHYDKAINDSDSSVRVNAVKSPYFKSEHMDQAINDDSPLVRVAAIESKYTKPEHIDKALDDDDSRVRWSAISSPAFGPQHIDKALQDDVQRVRDRVYKSPHFNEGFIDKYIDKNYDSYIKGEDEQGNTKRRLTKDEYAGYQKLKYQFARNPDKINLDKYKYNGPDALWVSMQKDADKGYDVNLHGEMCVTPFGEKEDIFRENEGHVGYVFRGKPSHFFPFDAYSEINRSTNRRYTNYLPERPNTNQKEAWLEPHKSEHVGTIHVSGSPNLDHFIKNDEKGTALAKDTHSQGLRHWVRFSNGKQMEIKPEHLESPEPESEIKIKKSIDQGFADLLESLIKASKL